MVLCCARALHFFRREMPDSVCCVPVYWTRSMPMSATSLFGRLLSEGASGGPVECPVPGRELAAVANRS